MTLAAQGSGDAALSIIIPAGPAESRVPALLARLEQLGYTGECLVVTPRGANDAPSTPPAAPAGVRWLSSQLGRAMQQNAGARSAQGRVLWFLHADSSLTPATLADARRQASQPGEWLAAFRLAFERDGPGLCALNAAFANWRSRRFGLPFGDQGLMIPRSTFLTLGGFDPAVPLGEDLDLAVRARHANLPLRLLPAVITTSARRYREAGWLRTTLRHLWLTVRLRNASRRRLRLARS